MPNYRRSFIAGGCFFFTVTLRDRRSTLLTDHIELLRRCVRTVRRAHPFAIDAWVVLPDHMHCIWTLPNGAIDYPTRWRLIKLLFSRDLPNISERSSCQVARREKGIWQRRYWEHTIRNELDFNHHVDYVHVNPVKHGFVTRVSDWPYSTFHRFVKAGILSSDWGSDISDLKTAQE